MEKHTGEGRTLPSCRCCLSLRPGLFVQVRCYAVLSAGAMRGMHGRREEQQLKLGPQPQAGLSLIWGKLWEADGIAEFTGCLYSHIRHWLWVVLKVRT